MPAEKKQLFCGDNLDVLRRYFADESIDLIYLDPPFNSNQDYNLLFRDKSGEKSASQILAFEDTWEWSDEAEKTVVSIVEQGGKVGKIMSLFRTSFGNSDMLAYLAMMAPRLVELHRVLKPTGSLYLHCDPTASHYLKMLMDAVFGPQCFVNEIIWKRSTAHSDLAQGAAHYGRIHDTLLFYSKLERRTWNQQTIALSEKYLATHYRNVEPDTGRRYELDNLTGPGGAAKGNPSYEVMGVTRYWRFTREKMERLIAEGRVVQPSPGAVPRYKRYLDESQGRPVQDIWDDIAPLNSQAKERLGYPTQKPQALLERIIQTSSNAGDTILDPFCGCGTAIEAADQLMRNWRGIDVTIQAMRVIRHERLSKLAYTAPKDYQVIYLPADISAAEIFAAEQPFAFQDWAVEMLNGLPTKARSGDRGVDGRLYFQDELDGPLRQILVSVKGGKLKATFVRELQGAVARERAAMGLLVTLHEPSKQMRRDIAAGVYTCASGTYPKTQFVTVQQILSGAALDLPPIRRMDEKKKRALVAAAAQMELPGVG